MKKIMRVAFSVVAILAAMTFTACSDGEMQPQVEVTKDLTTPQPVIIVFSADPATVKAGESTTINWEVAGADSVKITAVSTGEPLAFSVDTNELSGSQVAEGLTATTDFVLTAVKKLALPEGEGEAKAAKMKAEDAPAEGEEPQADEAPTEASVSQTITVVVEAASSLSVSATSDKSSVAPGESAIILWEISPADAQVKIQDDTGVDVAPTYAGDDCKIVDASELAATGTPVEAPQVIGCAVVAPQATATYKVIATLASGETQEADVTIEVASNLSAEIQISPETTANPNEAVLVSWLVSSPTALVTVTADQAVTCDPPLPAGEQVDYSETQCTLTSLPTTFTIEAVNPAVEGDSATNSATISQAEVPGGGMGAPFEVTASSDWAFEGEEVSISITSSSASSIKEISITDKSGSPKIFQGLPTDPISVLVPADGVTVTVTSLDGTERPYTAVPSVSARAVPITDAQAVTVVAFDPANPARSFTGFMMPGYNGGKVRIVADGTNVRDVPLTNVLKPKFGALAGMWSDANFERFIKTYPVNAISVRPGKPDEVYIGTTGGVVLEDFSKLGASDEFAMIIPTYLVSRNGHDYSGQHQSCRNKIQTGVRPSHSDEIIALNQICDIVIGAGGKMVIGSDYGVLAISDIDKFRAREIGWDEGNPLYARIVDDLECVDENCETVFAATSKGVFKSVDGGKNWEDFGSLGKKAFSVAALNDTVYAGAEDGVYSSDISSASWSQIGLGGQTVLSISVDPISGPFGVTVLAGTSAGAFVTRDSGATWSPVEIAGTDEVLSVAIGSTEPVNGNRMVAIGIASGKNVVSGEKPLSNKTKIVAVGTLPMPPETPPAAAQ